MTMLHSLIARRRFGPQTQWRPLHKAFFTNGLVLDDLSLAWPAVIKLVFPLTLARSGFWFIQEYFCLFYHSELYRRYGALIELESHYANWTVYVLLYYELHQDQEWSLSTVKNIFKPPVVYVTDRSKAVVPVLFLILCSFVVYTTGRLMF